MNKFRSITYGYIDGETGEDIELYIVVPAHETTETVIAAFMTGNEFDFVCECATQKDANLIASLLDKHYSMN